MRGRRFVAALILAALPVFAAVSSGGVGPVTRSSDWAYALGMKGTEALWFGLLSVGVCSTIPNPGAIACGAAGVL
jgi:hypothetical protein